VSKALKFEVSQKAITVYRGYDTVSGGDIQCRLRKVLWQPASPKRRYHLPVHIPEHCRPNLHEQSNENI